MSEPTFETRLKVLCAKELAEADNDQPVLRAERIAAMTEALATQTGMAVAVGCDGDGSLIETVLTGVENYLCEGAARFAPLAKMLSGLPSRKGSR